MRIVNGHEDRKIGSGDISRTCVREYRHTACLTSPLRGVSKRVVPFVAKGARSLDDWRTDTHN